jgi:hypothetical protein
MSAQALLDEFGIDCGNRVEQVAARLGLEVRDVIASSFDGALLRVAGQAVGTIVVRRGIDAGRRRFTIAHELGHYLLPDQQEGLATPCRQSSIESWESSVGQREIDANRFAAEILMPESLIGDIVRLQPSMAVAENIAARCQTSLTAAVVRLVELSTFRVAMAMSRDDAVRWYRVSREFGRSIRTGALDARTIAHDVIRDAAATGATLVPADAWLFDQNLQADAKVWEHSVALGSYESVLTLLEIRERIERRIEDDEELLAELDPTEFTLQRKSWPRK